MDKRHSLLVTHCSQLLSRQRTIRTEAIVLRQKEFREADRMLTVLTPDYGKLKLLAKGVRRMHSRKSGHLDLYNRVDLLLAKGRDWYIVTQADTLETYRCLREDLLRLSYAQYFVELLERFTIEDDANPEQYALLANAMRWNCDTENPMLMTHFYELQLLNQVGFRPELTHCVVSGEAVQPEDQFFDPIGGGLVRPNYGATQIGAFPISMDAVKVLRFLQRSQYEQIEQLTLRKPVAREVEQVMTKYIAALLERRLKSADFLHKVRQMTASFQPKDSE